MLFYVFDDEQTAINAEAYITDTGGAPLEGVNAATGEVNEEAVKTERWAIPRRRNDGKWVMPYIGDAVVAQYPDSVVDYFEDHFPNTKEEYKADWFPSSTDGDPD